MIDYEELILDIVEDDGGVADDCATCPYKGDNGGNIDDVEDMMMCDYGLEMDYIMDLLI